MLQESLSTSLSGLWFLACHKLTLETSFGLTANLHLHTLSQVVYGLPQTCTSKVVFGLTQTYTFNVVLILPQTSWGHTQLQVHNITSFWMTTAKHHRLDYYYMYATHNTPSSWVYSTNLHNLSIIFPSSFNSWWGSSNVILSVMYLIHLVVNNSCK